MNTEATIENGAEHAFDVIEDFWGQNLLGKLLNQVRDYIKYGK